MGALVSSADSNDDFVDNLLEHEYIESPLIERVFRAVDRAFYYTDPYQENPYTDYPWKHGNLNLSAPNVYATALEHLNLQPGMSFLNVGSGTGYFSTMCGLILGKTGVNHGIELYPDVVDYALTKLHEFLRTSPAVYEFNFCPPEFILGNCFDVIPASKTYDRIYCGAAASHDYIKSLVGMLKVGGVCVVPLYDSLSQITRVGGKKGEMEILLPLFYTTHLSPTDDIPRTPVILPIRTPKKLSDMCRSEIRTAIHLTITLPEPKTLTEENCKTKPKRQKERRRASRFVQRPRSGDIDGDNGFKAIAYSVNSNNSDEDRNQEGGTNEDNQDDNDEASSAVAGNHLNHDVPNPENDDALKIEAAKKPQPDPDSSTATADEISGTNSLHFNFTSSSTPSVEHSAGSSTNGIPVVSGSRSMANGKFPGESGTRSVEAKPRRPKRRSAGAAVALRRTSSVSAPRSARNARNCTTEANSWIGILEMVANDTQPDIELMLTLLQSSDADHSQNRSNTGRDDSNTDLPAESSPSRSEQPANGAVEPIDTDMSSSNSSPSASETSASSDDEVAAETPTHGTKKRHRNDMNDNDKVSKNEHSPHPLLISPYSVQMRKKIQALPLPDPLKEYLNYEKPKPITQLMDELNEVVK